MTGPLSNSNGDHAFFSNEMQFDDNPESWPMTPADWAAFLENEQTQDTTLHPASQAPAQAPEEAMPGTWPGADHEQEQYGLSDANSEVTVVFPDPLEAGSSSPVTGSRRHLVRLESELSSYGLRLSQHIYANPPPFVDETGTYVPPQDLFIEAVAHLRASIPELPPIEELAGDVFNNRDSYTIGPNNSYLQIVTILLQLVSKKMQGRITFDIGHLRKTQDGWHFTIEHASPDFEASHLLLACGDVFIGQYHNQVVKEVWRLFTVPAFTRTNAQTTHDTASADMGAPSGSAAVNIPTFTLRPNALLQQQPGLQPRPRPTSDSSKEVKKTTARTGHMPENPHAYTGEEYKDVPDAELLNGTIHTDKIFGELAGRVAKACGGDKEIERKINYLRVNVEGQQALKSDGWFTHRLKLWYKRKADDSNGKFTKDQFKAQFLEERYGKPVHAARLNNQGQYKPGANLSAKTLAKRKRSASADDESNQSGFSPNQAPRKKRSLRK